MQLERQKSERQKPEKQKPEKQESEKQKPDEKWKERELLQSDCPRTDLALEVRERFEEDRVEIKGVKLEKSALDKHGTQITKLTIITEEGAQTMGKPIGTYITIEAPNIAEHAEDGGGELSEQIAEQLSGLIGEVSGKTVLIAGLGNREATPDALGPLVIDRLFVTRHLVREFGDEYPEMKNMTQVSAVAVGVMAQTGMESYEIIKGVIDQIHPEVLIAVDALAARNVSRMNTTVQLTDTGILPGAGIGNNRRALNKESLGIPVVAIGVPTVVDAVSIVRDSMERFFSEQGLSEEENETMLHQIRESVRMAKLGELFVTPKNIDEAVRQISEILADALNLAFGER